MAVNPFLSLPEPTLQEIANEARDKTKAEIELQKTVPVTHSVTSNNLARGRKMIADAGIKIGDLVTISWPVDDAYGGGIRSHMGTVERLDDWIHIGETNRSPGHLRMPIAAMKMIRLERSSDPAPASDNPFMQISAPAPVSNNPFMT